MWISKERRVSRHNDLEGCYRKPGRTLTIMELRIPQQGDPLEIILKLAGETCNINCYYCYEKRKPYERAKTLSAADLCAFLHKMGGRPLRLHLHGGEPLLIGLKR